MNSDPPSSLVAASRVVLQPQDVIGGINVSSDNNNVSSMCSSIQSRVDYHNLNHQSLNSTSLIHNTSQIVSDTTITSTQIAQHQPLLQTSRTVPVQGVIVQTSPQLLGLSVKGKHHKQTFTTRSINPSNHFTHIVYTAFLLTPHTRHRQMALCCCEKSIW